jgi:sugar (pentulose or hexulose) kinase
VAEATSRGAALLALEALGAIKNLEEVPHFILPGCEPVPQRHARYRLAIERQEELYRKLIGAEKSESRNSV